MEAAKAAGVQRVSITSSMAAICSMDAADKPECFDESHWSDVEWPGMSAYEKSKTLAERAAWDFVAAQPENERIGLTVINPTFIVGPTLIPGDFSSGKILSMFMNNNMPGGCPRIKMGTVDVRDVAKAHVNAIKSDDAQGKRFILAGKTYWFAEIGQMLHDEFGTQGYTIPHHEAKYCLVRFFGYFRADAAKIADMWGVENVHTNERSRQILDIEYISA